VDKEDKEYEINSCETWTNNLCTLMKYGYISKSVKNQNKIA